VVSHYAFPARVSLRCSIATAVEPRLQKFCNVAFGSAPYLVPEGGEFLFNVAGAAVDTSCHPLSRVGSRQVDDEFDNKKTCLIGAETAKGAGAILAM
jgi:hypothetical protein